MQVERTQRIAVKKLSIEKMEGACEEVSELLRALSHPGRLLVMGHLMNGRKTVGELQQLCELSQSQLSQFLARMKSEGLVVNERAGKFQYYQIVDGRIVQLLGEIQKIFCK